MNVMCFVQFPYCYSLNVDVLKSSYVQTLSSRVMVWGGGAFEKSRRQSPHERDQSPYKIDSQTILSSWVTLSY